MVTACCALQEKIFKKKLMLEMPRRTSDRLAMKAVQRIEEVSVSSRELALLEMRNSYAFLVPVNITCYVYCDGDCCDGAGEDGCTGERAPT